MAYDTSSREEGSFGFGAIAVCRGGRVRPAGPEKRGDEVTIALPDRDRSTNRIRQRRGDRASSDDVQAARRHRQ